jgi:hypothetical protein
MPHEKLPDPDWTRASDKSAAEWQAEAGIGALDEAEKEKTLARLIAQAKGGENFSSAPAQGNGGKGNGNGNGTHPPVTAYKRWKPT